MPNRDYRVVHDPDLMPDQSTVMNLSEDQVEGLEARGAKVEIIEDAPAAAAPSAYAAASAPMESVQISGSDSGAGADKAKAK